MALVTTVNICRVRGDTDSFTVVLTDAAGNPIDLTGSTFLFTVDPAEDPADALANLFQLSVGSGIVLTDPVNGELTLTLSAAQADQTPNVYFYDLQWTSSGGAIKTVLKGQWEVIQDITK